jgi:hypothetical protein
MSMVAQAIHATTGGVSATFEGVDDGSERMILTQSAQVPQAVVNRSNFGAVLRMADFREQDRRGHLSHTVAKAEHKAASDVHWGMVISTADWTMTSAVIKSKVTHTAVAIAKCTEKTAKDHKNTSQGNWNLSPNVVCEDWTFGISISSIRLWFRGAGKTYTSGKLQILPIM